MYALCMYVFYVHKFALNVFLKFKEKTELLCRLVLLYSMTTAWK